MDAFARLDLASSCGLRPTFPNGVPNTCCAVLALIMNFTSFCVIPATVPLFSWLTLSKVVGLVFAKLQTAVREAVVLTPGRNPRAPQTQASAAKIPTVLSGALGFP